MRVAGVTRVLVRAGFPIVQWDTARNVITGVPGWTLRVASGRTGQIATWLDKQTEGMDREGPYGVIAFGPDSNATRTAFIVMPYIEWAGLVARAGSHANKKGD
jgi:hypothetical protein